MRRHVRRLCAVCFLLVLAGCLAISVGGSRRKKCPEPRSATCAEIEAAVSLSMPTSRTDALLRIAGREGLSPHEQIHLARAALEHLSFPTNEEKVITALIQNPDFCDDAKLYILDNLREISFPNSRENVLRAIDEREKRKRAEAKERAAAEADAPP